MTVKSELKELTNVANAKMKKLALRVRKETVVPFCDKYGIDFVSSSDSFSRAYMFRTKEREYISYYSTSFIGLREAHSVLELVGPGNVYIGDFVASYEGKTK